MRVLMGKKNFYKKGFLSFITEEIEVIEKFIEDHPDMTKSEATREWIIQHAEDYKENYDKD